MTGGTGGCHCDGLAISLRGVAALLLAMLVVALAACGREDSPESGGEDGRFRAEATEEEGSATPKLVGDGETVKIKSSPSAPGLVTPAG